MDYISVTDVIKSNAELRKSYRVARVLGYVSTTCLVVSILLILYQFLYGETKLTLIIWVVLLLASIFLSIFSRGMLRRVLEKAERIRVEKMTSAARAVRPEVDGY